MEARYAEIVFMQDEEGWDVVNPLCNVEGVVMHGATFETMSAAVDHLAQWDNGEYAETFTYPDLVGRFGTYDRWIQIGRYILSWNQDLGYVGLAVEVEQA